MSDDLIIWPKNANARPPKNLRELEIARRVREYNEAMERKKKEFEAAFAHLQAQSANHADFFGVFVGKMPRNWIMRSKVLTGEKINPRWVARPSKGMRQFASLRGLIAFRLTKDQAMMAKLRCQSGERVIPDPEGEWWMFLAEQSLRAKYGQSTGMRWQDFNAFCQKLDAMLRGAK